MGYLNGVVVKEAIELKSQIDTDNPLVGPDEMQLSYDSIDPVTGVYIGVRARVGPGRWLDCTEVFNNAGSAKLLKSPTQTVDYAYTLTLSTGDISALGANVSILMLLVNAVVHPFVATFSNYPCSASDTILFTGLETVADTTSLQILLG